MKHTKDLLAKLDAGSVEMLKDWKESRSFFPVVYSVTSGIERRGADGVTTHLPSRNDYYVILATTTDRGTLDCEAGRPIAVLTLKPDTELRAVVDATNKHCGWTLEGWELDENLPQLCEAELEQRRSPAIQN